MLIIKEWRPDTENSLEIELKNTTEEDDVVETPRIKRAIKMPARYLT